MKKKKAVIKTSTKSRISLKSKAKVPSGAIKTKSIAKILPVVPQGLELFTDFMDQVPDVVYFKNLKGQFVLVNKAYAKGLKLKPAQIIGKTDFDFFPKDRAERMTEDDNFVMQTGYSIIDKIERATRPDGQDNFVSTTKVPHYNKSGKIIGMICVTRDVTKRLKAEQAREKRAEVERQIESLEEDSSNEMKSEFISAVSHELRTPLAVMKQLFLLIYDEIPGPINDKQREIVVKVRSQIDRLTGIIDKLLDASRIERETLKLQYSLVNLSALLKETRTYFKKQAAEKNIKITYQLPKHAITIFVDAERIVQVITNLVTNAIKFTGENGSIKVQLEVLQSKVRVGVIDTGMGISEEDLPKIFNKFVQVGKKSEDRKKGLGLGLAIVKELVEQHGGEIWAESEAGVGTKIYFTLFRFYTATVVPEATQERINEFLALDKSVFLVNLMIVNYDEFKKKVDVKPKDFYGQLRRIMDEAHQEIFHEHMREDNQIEIAEIQQGKYSVIFSGVKARVMSDFCECVRDKTKFYFLQNNIDDVFIALGMMAYSVNDYPQDNAGSRTNLNIKEIYIGSEIRRSKRIKYNTALEAIYPDKASRLCQTVDLSENGSCFDSHVPIKTDEIFKVKIELIKKREIIQAAGRMAWIKDLGIPPGETMPRYRMGIEFTKISKKDQKLLSEELKLYYE
ncbi:MAG: PAS domain-containing protein [Candidatus Omnitrophica bacterium]|nr:PAS domain-containing protein [Candidatus Omnitrophota bacterium]